MLVVCNQSGPPAAARLLGTWHAQGLVSQGSRHATCLTFGVAVEIAQIVKRESPSLPALLRTLGSRFSPGGERMRALQCSCKPAARRGDCALCSAFRLLPTWKRKFLVDGKSPELGSWIEERKGESGWAVGCKCCAAAKNFGPFASYLVRIGTLAASNLAKHHKSWYHVQAAKRYATGTDIALGFNGAPQLEEFAKTAEAVKAGTATLSTRRSAKLTWCLAEALKVLDQRFVQRPCVVTLFRDERHGRIAVRFRAVDKALNVRAGTLGVEVNPGTGADNVTKATAAIFRRFCFRFHGAPVPPKRRPLELRKLRHKLRRAVVNLVVDSAADELLSGEIMRSGTLAIATPLTPNLRCILRDKAHASRRLAEQSS